ncbi:AAA family ATPase [Chryseobacterium sp. PBS4-4]|uniref:AAA family ATPase n=1 Tax=Chryseobacterium edaphi TaxID=2976532 RepID=A0ABT2W427_9FLAO|nr:AAA family ATPase [Chryseobacterium edaphi]MCU7616971.1 AAA family ATPase [Chryseobacterium edaphi]
MKLRKVKVEKLFGVFNHEIILNDHSQITIIIGENGLGKTVLLEMIEAFFKGSFFYFNTIEFESIKFEFDDEISWILTKNMNNEIPLLELFQVNKNKKESKPMKLNSFQSRDMELLALRISREIPHLKRIGPRAWDDRLSNQILNSEQLLFKYGDYIPHDIYLINEEVPKWFSDKNGKIKVSLIETQRLISLEEKEGKTHKKTVEKYSFELTEQIKSFLTESTELSSKLDRTYPNRLIDRIKNLSNVTDQDLNSELKRLEKKRELLDTVGLIEIEKDSNILEIENPQDVVRDVLMLYVEDSFKKIEIFDQLAAKIEILLDIVNKRFKHKKLYIDKDKGFLFKSTIIFDLMGNQQIIPVTKLSSGEQNELVLFYLLLFNTEPNSLILIDEPEVSLHISWQNTFIEDLKQIVKLNNLEVVIATHSPDIISNNWNLKVELKGLE